jgi:YD repeat-containing protein
MRRTLSKAHLSGFSTVMGMKFELTQIESPRGRWIRFDYSQLHLIRARDSSNNAVEYDYDSGDHLTAVKYSTWHITHYSYDTADRVVGVEDPSENVGLVIQYDSKGAVTAVRTDSEHIYTFRCISDNAAKATLAFVVEPNGRTIKVDQSRYSPARWQDCLFRSKIDL